MVKYLIPSRQDSGEKVLPIYPEHVDLQIGPRVRHDIAGSGCYDKINRGAFSVRDRPNILPSTHRVQAEATILPSRHAHIQDARITQTAHRRLVPPENMYTKEWRTGRTRSTRCRTRCYIIVRLYALTAGIFGVDFSEVGIRSVSRRQKSLLTYPHSTGAIHSASYDRVAIAVPALLNAGDGSLVALLRACDIAHCFQAVHFQRIVPVATSDDSSSTYLPNIHCNIHMRKTAAR